MALRQFLIEQLAQQPVDGDPSMPAGLERLCRSLVEEIDVAGATITLMTDDGSQGLAATSDPWTAALDAVQFDVGEGPSREAYDAGRPVLVPDLSASDGRWPGFLSASQAHGLAAVYAFPLQEGAVRLGVLTCYAVGDTQLDRAGLSACAVYAEVATRYLIAQDAHPGAGSTQSSFLDKDVQIRTEVYQAQGMVMVELRISLTEALARMRATAFADGISLNQLALDVVAGRRRIDGAAADEADPDVTDP